jgi:hypothetical protein
MAGGRSPSAPVAATEVSVRVSKPSTAFQHSQSMLDEMVALSKLPSLRFDARTSLADFVGTFSVPTLVPLIRQTAPTVFQFMRCALLRTTRSGRPHSPADYDKADLQAAHQILMLLKQCNRRCDGFSKHLTLAMMGKSTPKGVRS